jgi:hypothetical protein
VKSFAFPKNNKATDPMTQAPSLVSDQQLAELQFKNRKINPSYDERDQNLSIEKLMYKLSASVVYAILSAVALNFFFQPGHVYSSGITGLAQILRPYPIKCWAMIFPSLSPCTC